jgi:hypothetical protein
MIPSNSANNFLQYMVELLEKKFSRGRNIFISRYHLIKKKSMISKSYSGVAGFNFCLISELFDELNVIFTLSILVFDKYCYLLN